MYDDAPLVLKEFLMKGHRLVLPALPFAQIE